MAIVVQHGGGKLAQTGVAAAALGGMAAGQKKVASYQLADLREQERRTQQQANVDVEHGFQSASLQENMRQQAEQERLAAEQRHREDRVLRAKTMIANMTDSEEARVRDMQASIRNNIRPLIVDGRLGMHPNGYDSAEHVKQQLRAHPEWIRYEPIIEQELEGQQVALRSEQIRRENEQMERQVRQQQAVFDVTQKPRFEQQERMAQEDRDYNRQRTEEDRQVRMADAQAKQQDRLQQAQLEQRKADDEEYGNSIKRFMSTLPKDADETVRNDRLAEYVLGRAKSGQRVPAGDLEDALSRKRGVLAEKLGEAAKKVSEYWTGDDSYDLSGEEIAEFGIEKYANKIKTRADLKRLAADPDELLSDYIGLAQPQVEVRPVSYRPEQPQQPNPYEPVLRANTPTLVQTIRQAHHMNDATAVKALIPELLKRKDAGDNHAFEYYTELMSGYEGGGK